MLTALHTMPASQQTLTGRILGLHVIASMVRRALAACKKQGISWLVEYFLWRRKTEEETTKITGQGFDCSSNVLDQMRSIRRGLAYKRIGDKLWIGMFMLLCKVQSRKAQGSTPLGSAHDVHFLLVGQTPWRFQYPCLRGMQSIYW